MMGRTLIREALRARLLAVPGIPAVRALEGERFTRPLPGVPWLRETFLPGGSQVEGLPAQTGDEITNGVYAVDLFQGMGATPLAALETLSVAICAAFRPGWPNGVVDTGDAQVRVTVFGGSSLPVRPEDPWQFLPVTIRWRSQVPNTYAA